MDSLSDGVGTALGGYLRSILVNYIGSFLHFDKFSEAKASVISSWVGLGQ